jgi:hypothetical protein
VTLSSAGARLVVNQFERRVAFAPPPKVATRIEKTLTRREWRELDVKIAAAGF